MVLQEISVSLLNAKFLQGDEIESEILTSIMDRFEFLQVLEDEQEVERSQKKLLKKKKAEELQDEKHRKQTKQEERWKKAEEKDLQNRLEKEEREEKDRLALQQPYVWSTKMTWSKFFSTDLTENKVEYVKTKLKSQVGKQEIDQLRDKIMEHQMDEDLRSELISIANEEFAKMELIHKQNAERRKKKKEEIKAQRKLKQALEKQEIDQADDVNEKEDLVTISGDDQKEQTLMNDYFRVVKGDKGKKVVK